MADTIVNTGIELASRMEDKYPNYADIVRPDNSTEYFAMIIGMVILGGMFMFYRISIKNKHKENPDPEINTNFIFTQLKDGIEKLCNKVDKNTEKLGEVSNRLHMIEKIYELEVMKNATHK